jgi:hypothetical protein
MNTTAVAVPVRAGQSLAHAARFAFVTLAIVALLAVSFLIGRATVGSDHAPAIAPTAPTAPMSGATTSRDLPNTPTNVDACHFGPPC